MTDRTLCAGCGAVIADDEVGEIYADVVGAYEGCGFCPDCHREVDLTNGRIVAAAPYEYEKNVLPVMFAIVVGVCFVFVVLLVICLGIGEIGQ